MAAELNVVFEIVTAPDNPAELEFLNVAPLSTVKKPVPESTLEPKLIEPETVTIPGKLTILLADIVKPVVFKTVTFPVIGDGRPAVVCEPDPLYT